MYSSRFKIINWTLDYESGGDPNGGDHTDPTDPGGRTKWGIAHNEWPLIDLDSLTRQGAYDFYVKNFWIPCGGDKLPSPLDGFVFDAAVNEGLSVALQMLQKLVGVTPDGIWGPDTLKAVLAHDYDDIAAKFAAKRILGYATMQPEADRLGWASRVILLSMAT